MSKFIRCNFLFVLWEDFLHFLIFFFFLFGLLSYLWNYFFTFINLWCDISQHGLFFHKKFSLLFFVKCKWWTKSFCYIIIIALLVSSIFNLCQNPFSKFKFAWIWSCIDSKVIVILTRPKLFKRWSFRQSHSRMNMFLVIIVKLLLFKVRQIRSRLSILIN